MTQPLLIDECIAMSVEDWIQIPDNPRQRDTERRLVRAKHLLTPSPEHRLVHMAQGPGSKCWKLDGHTRALGWQRGAFPAPDKVQVYVIHVRDEDAAKDLYDHYDSKTAVKTTVHAVEGAFREHNFYPQSRLLASGAIGNALRIAEGLWNEQRRRSDSPLSQIVGTWKSSLQRLDEIQPVNSPKKNKFVGPVIAASLMSFRKYKGDATEFWTEYNLEHGEKIGQMMDPVEALTQFMMTCMVVTSNYHDIVGKALNAFEGYLDNRTYTTGLKALDPTRFSKSKLVVSKWTTPAREAKLRVGA